MTPPIVEPKTDPAHTRRPRTTDQTQAALLLVKLTQEAAGPPPTEQEIARRYHAHPQWYGSPEIRFMRLVATDSRDEASAARRALERGDGWKAVISRYSTDRNVSPASGAMGSAPREMPPRLDQTLYTARKNTLDGPVKTADAWYVLELIAIDELPGQTLTQARDAIRAEIQQQQAAHAHHTLLKRLIATHRPKTHCNYKLLLPECSNGPPIAPSDLTLPRIL